MLKTIVVILTTFVLALSAAPLQSFEQATADDTARFLAGLPPSSSSPLAALTKDPAWPAHARYFDSIFAREDSANLSKVREFSKNYLTDKHDTMLYMFSGPDFLYATSFFPNASTYVLAGLEPVGGVPDLTSLNPLVINGELRNLEISMGSLFNFSFFVTHNMKTQLRNGVHEAKGLRSYRPHQKQVSTFSRNPTTRASHPSKDAASSSRSPVADHDSMVSLLVGTKPT